MGGRSEVAGSAAGLEQAGVLIVDDKESNVVLLRRLLEQAGYSAIETATDPAQALERARERTPDLVLLDIHMPGMDGFELLGELGPVFGVEGPLPVIMLTGDLADEVRRRALSEGASDFITKPFNATEVVLRVRNVLQTHRLHVELERANATLEERVRERTEELSQARLEILNRLAIAGEFRDDATGEHAQRVGRISALLASALKFPADRVELVRHAATLHDIGKIGISDAVLLKPGKFTVEEYEQMKAHTTIGARILSGSDSPLLQMAEEIAHHHHERWDGSGYPNGLAGSEIPILGRIAAVADVFDALTQNRPYRDAWGLNDAVEEIDSQAGRHFDPRVVEAFSHSIAGAAAELMRSGASS